MVYCQAATIERSLLCRSIVHLLLWKVEDVEGSDAVGWGEQPDAVLMI